MFCCPVCYVWRGRFSFCFALGQIQPGDKISSQSLGLPLRRQRLSLEQRALSEPGGGSPVSGGKTRRWVQRCSRTSAGNQSCAGAETQSRAGVPAPRSPELCVPADQVVSLPAGWKRREPARVQLSVQFNNPHRTRSTGAGGAASGSTLDSPDIISSSSGLALQDWASSHKKS